MRRARVLSASRCGLQSCPFHALRSYLNKTNQQLHHVRVFLCLLLLCLSLTRSLCSFATCVRISRWRWRTLGSSLLRCGNGATET